MNYIIRLAVENDCKELSKLKKLVWETTYRGIYPDEKLDNYDYEKNEETFRKIINNNDIELYVIESNGNIIGYMDYGKPSTPFRDYKQEIGLLYLLKDYQKKGIGKKLFLLAYSKMKNKGYNNFFVSCNKYNLQAQKFYESMGGKIVHVDEDAIDKSISKIKYHFDIN